MTSVGRSAKTPSAERTVRLRGADSVSLLIRGRCRRGYPPITISAPAARTGRSTRNYNARVALLRSAVSWRNQLLVTLLATSSLSSFQQPPDDREKLGKVHFPISCGGDAQEQFDRGLAMLHSFWYPQGLEAFVALTKSNPECAMAYWGIAISARANPLVGSPDAAAIDRGWQAVAKAKAAGGRTDRE